MSKETITFRIDEKKKAALDAVAVSMDRDRSYIINEAVESFLSIHKWQIEEINKGLKEADTEDFASDKEVKSIFQKWSDVSD